MAGIMKENVTVRVVDEEMVCIPAAEYARLLGKAERMDILAESIREAIRDNGYVLVDENLVLLLTGMNGELRAAREEKRRQAAVSNEEAKAAARDALHTARGAEEDEEK